MLRLGILCAFACLGAAYVVWAWSDQVTDFGGDSAAYMLMARLLSPFTVGSPALTEAARATPFPPLFPALVGLFGAGFLAGHLIAVSTLLAALVALYRWLRAEGLGPLASSGTALAFALMPGTYFQALNIMSENPYLALSLLCIVVERRAQASGPGRPVLWWVAAGVVAAAPLVRTAALPLMAAFAMRLLIVKPRRWPWMIVASAVPLAAWLAWGAFHRTGVAVYASQAAPMYAHAPVAALLAQLAAESWMLLGGWIEAWLSEGRARVLIDLVFLLGVVCLLGGARRLAALKFDAIYVALYLAVLLVWPFPDAAQRLSYVIVPVLLAQGVLLIHSSGWTRHRPGSVVVPALCTSVPAIVLLPTLLLTIARFAAPVPAGMEVARHSQYWYRTLDTRTGVPTAEFLAAILDDLPKLNRLVPAGECIFSIKPTLVALYSGHMSYAPPEGSTSAAQFSRDIGRCRYAYVLAISSPAFPEPLYPLHRLQQPVRVVSGVEADKRRYPIPLAELLEIGAPR
jgi:hypothetical protein